MKKTRHKIKINNDYLKDMEPGLLAEIIGSSSLMALWLVLVAITAYLAIKKYKNSVELRKKQFGCLALATVIVFIGDFIHTIGFVIGKVSSDPQGTIELFTFGTLEARHLAFFIDGLVFILFYASWVFILATRYQEGKLTQFDKIVLSIASFSLLTSLLSPYIQITGIEYIISIYSLHILTFLIFRIMIVGKLIYITNEMRKKETEYKKEEKLLLIAGLGFALGIIFFILTLALVPLNPKFGLFMIPNTFVYMLAFGSLVRLLLLKEEKIS